MTGLKPTPDVGAVSMMNTNCPKCNLELNDQGECARCGQVVAAAAFAQAEDTAARDLSYGGAPVNSDDADETDPAVVMPHAADEFSAFPVEDEAESADAQAHAGDDDASFEVAGDGWAGEGAGGDALPDEAYEEYEVAEEDALPLTAAKSFSTSVGGRGRVETIITGESIVVYPPPPAAGPKDDERTLIDFTEVLPSKSPSLPEFVFEELQEYLDKLKEDRLVLISCPDEDVAYSAAHALIDGLNLPQGRQRRLLNVDRSAGEDWPLSIYYLSGKRDSEDEMVVLVDAATERARPFLEPIIRANRLSSAAIQDDLRRNDMYMLCLLDPALLDDGPRPDDGGPRPAGELKFPCWRIPFLRRLLARYIEQPEEVERQITAQRADGRWSLNDSQFYYEVKSYLLRRELPAELERRAKTPQRSPEDIFKGDDPLSATVLYVATYFPNLTAPEFNRLVPLLCGDAAGGADGDAGTRAESGERVGERLQVWRAAPDEILKDCSLVTIPLSDETRGVNFSNHNLRDRLREYLERDHNFFLENKFRDVQKLGLIFSPSARVAQSAAQLCVEKAAAYPEYYGSGWLAELVTDFEAALAGTAPGEAPAWRFISEPNAVKARKQFYQSLAELIRALTEHPQAAEVAENFLQQLLLAKHRGAVLEIVRRLQFAPSFDQFKWLKQLLDQGNQQVREQTSDYLRGHLKRMRGRVYQALSSLESWLPKDARPLHGYSVPARHALRLIHAYFRETNSRFDARDFGAWPSAHPLFAFNDAATAAVNLGLLVRLLFHPGMYGVFKEQGVSRTRGVILINGIVTNWFFVLEGRSEGGPRGRGGDAGAGEAELDAAAVSNLLLEEIARGVNAGQQAALAAYWRAESERLLKAMSDRPHGGAAWQSSAWRRDLLIGLIRRFEPLRHRTGAGRRSVHVSSELSGSGYPRS